MYKYNKQINNIIIYLFFTFVHTVCTLPLILGPELLTLFSYFQNRISGPLPFGYISYIAVIQTSCPSHQQTDQKSHTSLQDVRRVSLLFKLVLILHFSKHSIDNRNCRNIILGVVVFVLPSFTLFVNPFTGTGRNRRFEAYQRTPLDTSDLIVTYLIC